MKKLAVFVIFSFLIMLSLQQTIFAQIEEKIGSGSGGDPDCFLQRECTINDEENKTEEKES